MTEIIIISVLSVSTLVLGFTTWNLLRKNEATEDVIEEQEELIANIASRIDDSMKKMKELDTRGAFEAEDETGGTNFLCSTIPTGRTNFRLQDC